MGERIGKGIGKGIGKVIGRGERRMGEIEEKEN